MVRRSPLLLLGLVALIGCQSATESVTPPPAAQAPVPTAGSSAPASDAKATPEQTASKAIAANSPAPVDDHKTPPAQPVAKNFTPPFPDRADLFDPPHSSAGVVRRDEEHGATVELKGFVNVNGQQVVLAIDGVISPIPEGGEKYGVQVISIKPPSVVLQRGRSRWTASLE
ncbi:MAG TPA: hypothetical protein VGM76_13325 [Lacipirellulaceae bacterium]|jgi:hypothetical protein